MEDFFQILIFILFIIISIASSRKKKSKPPVKVKPKVSPNRQNIREKINAAAQNNRTNILEELLGLKLPEKEPQKIEVPNYKAATNYGSYEKLSAEEEAEYERINEDGVSDYYNEETKEKSELSNENDRYKAFKTPSGFIEESKLRRKIYSMMAEKNSLKDYIIIQEILNKPKALRR